jgi:hypothetical protein
LAQKKTPDVVSMHPAFQVGRAAMQLHCVRMAGTSATILPVMHPLTERDEQPFFNHVGLGFAEIADDTVLRVLLRFAHTVIVERFHEYR